MTTELQRAAQALLDALKSGLTFEAPVMTLAAAEDAVARLKAALAASPVEAPAQPKRGEPCEVMDGDPASPTHRQWLPARFVALDLVGGEPIVQRDGCMPAFATWGSVRGIQKPARNIVDAGGEVYAQRADGRYTAAVEAKPESPTEWDADCVAANLFYGIDLPLTEPQADIIAARLNLVLQPRCVAPAEAPERPALPPLEELEDPGELRCRRCNGTGEGLLWTGKKGVTTTCGDCKGSGSVFGWTANQTQDYARSYGAACVAADRAGRSPLQVLTAMGWKIERAADDPERIDITTPDNERLSGYATAMAYRNPALYALCSALIGTDAAAAAAKE